MRRTWALALLAACATARAVAPSAPAAPVQAEDRDARLIEEIRGQVERNWRHPLASSIEFGPLAHVAVSRIEVEAYHPRVSDKWVCIPEWYDFLVATADGATAEVVRIEGATRDAHRGLGKIDDMSPYGAWATRATVPRASFDRMARKAALVLGARIPGVERWDTETRFAVRLDTAVDVPWPLAGTITSPSDLHAAVALGVILDEIGTWGLEAVEDPDTIASCLVAGDVAPWQWDARVPVLGLLGCVSALPVLDRLGTRGVEVAREQIRTLEECKGAAGAPESLMDLARGGDRTLGPWALVTLRERFPADYRTLLYEKFGSAELYVRSAAFDDLLEYDPSDLSLARRARDDPDPELRFRAAKLLGDLDLQRTLASDRASPAELRLRIATELADAALLVALARDPTMPGEARRAAIAEVAGPQQSWTSVLGDWDPWVRDWKGYVRRNEPKGDRQLVGAALVALLDDPLPRVRSRAVAALADIGCVEATPALVAKLRAALAEPQDMTLATDVAIALGFLGAKEAVEPIDQGLLGRTSNQFEVVAGFALALVPDARVRPILEREAAVRRPWPTMQRKCAENLALHKSVRRAQAQGIVEGGRERAAPLLAEAFSREELREFATEGVVDRSVAERALALER